MKKTCNNLSRFFLPAIVMLFLFSRLGYLNLPFYWDEAWSYAIAVFDMHSNGMAIIPGDGNIELTRGHPLLFYFLATLWTKIFGTELLAVHLFPLMVSMLMLVAVFYVAFKLFDKATAITATLLFALQGIFMAQSTLLLPEVMLALWTLLTFYAYFSKKWTLFAIVSVFLVMTKETGIILIGTLFLDILLLERVIYPGEKKEKQLITKEIIVMCLPVLIFAVFMILQKIRLGWYLYPGHLNLAILNPLEIANRIRLFSSKLLFQHGRNIFFLFSLATLIFFLIKRSITSTMAHYLLFSGVFIACYIGFSSVNFFTTRYLLSLVPFLIIPGSWLITTLLKRNWMKTAVVSTFALLFAYYAFIGNRNELDTSLGFKNTVLLHKQAVNYAEEMQWQQKSIYAAFLMQYYLSVPDLGYLNDKSHPFVNISNKAEKKYNLYLFCSNENDPLHTRVMNNPEFLLIKKFKQKGAWVEFYSKKDSR